MKIEPLAKGPQFMPLSSISLALSVALLVTIAGCAGPQITKRYDSRESAPASDSQPTAAKVWVFPVPEQSSPAKSLAATLEGEGEAAFINAFAAKMKASEVVNLLSKPLKTGSGPQVDFTKFSRKLALVLDADFKGEADRLQEVEYDIALLGDTAKVTSMDRWATQYETVNLGELSFTRASSVSAEAALTPTAPTISGINFGGSVTETLGEKVVLSRQLPREIPRVVGDSKVQFHRRGEVGLTLLGALVMELQIALKSTKVLQLTNVTGIDRSSPKDLATLEILNIRVPNTCTPVNAAVTVKADVRRVAKGGETFTEADDTIWVEKNVTAADSLPVELVNAKQLELPVWEIVEVRPGGEDGKKLHLAQMSNKGDGVVVQFLDLGAAETALAWLKKHRPDTLAGWAIFLGAAALPDSHHLTSGHSLFSKLAVRRSELNQACNGRG